MCTMSVAWCPSEVRRHQSPWNYSHDGGKAAGGARYQSLVLCKGSKCSLPDSSLQSLISSLRAANYLQ